MTLRPDNTLISNREMLTELVLTPLRKLGAILEGLVVSTARVQALKKIASLSEEELRAKGTTRAELISLTFRHD